MKALQYQSVSSIATAFLGTDRCRRVGKDINHDGAFRR